jgi:hypothetical protein
MGGLSRQPNRTPRKAREERAYRLAVLGAGAGLICVVTIVLAILGIVGGGVPLAAGAVAAISAYFFKRTVS